jgi:heavy metal sensor kinase
MKPPRLRIRLTLWFSASILLILLPVLAGVAAWEWQLMRGALDHHLEEDLEFALQMLVVQRTDVIWRAELETDPGYNAGRRRWVEVYDQGGRLRYVRGVPEDGRILSALPPVTSDPPGFHTRRTPAGAYVRLLTAQRPLGGEAFWIRVARTEDDLRVALQQMLFVFALGATLAVLTASAAGYVISGRTLTPLARMAERARVISADRLSERLPIANPDDELGQLGLVFNDTFARLQASFDRLKRFTADVSHELRTPLTAIRSVGEVGLQASRSVDDYQEVIGSMLEEADRLAHVVDTLLTLSRWESGRVKPISTPIDLADIARDVASHLSVLADERQVEIVVTAQPGLIVSGDAIMLRQAVINVVDNAIKFTTKGSRVTISAASPSGEHALVVDDQGPGIPEADRARVTERFYRLDRDREQSVPGFGLGLALVQRALEIQGGRLTFGANPSGGARVILALPRS